MPIFNPKELHAFLQEEGLAAKKHLSQNFLIDGNILRKIVHTADVHEGDIVFEIGPGPGALTEELLKAKAHVTAIEMDKQLAKLLERLKKEDNHLNVIQQDCLDFAWEAYFEKHLPEGKKAKIVANLPYKITTPILARLLPLHQYISSITVMVQHEVGVRFIAQKNTADYSSFTIFLSYYAHAKYCFTISPNCFYPKPKIDSALVHLTLKEPQRLDSPEAFFQFVRSCFQKRRKMLRSSLKEIYPPERVEHFLKELGLSPLARPEELSLQNFIFLYQSLKE